MKESNLIGIAFPLRWRSEMLCASRPLAPRVASALGADCRAPPVVESRSYDMHIR